MKPLVYLAGPITGCTYEGCTDWRKSVSEQLGEKVHCLSPMRHKDYLLNEDTIKDSYSEYYMSTTRAIITRDRFDCTRCTILFVNLLGATRVSIGTVLELAWADAHRIPIIVVMEKQGNIHDHGMVREIVGFRCETLEQGVEAARSILDVDQL